MSPLHNPEPGSWSCCWEEKAGLRAASGRADRGPGAVGTQEGGTQSEKSRGENGA